MVADQSYHCLNRGRGRNRDRDRILFWLAPRPHGPLKLRCRVVSAPQQYGCAPGYSCLNLITRSSDTDTDTDSDPDPELASSVTFSDDLKLGPPRNVHVHSEAVHVHVHDDVASTSTSTSRSRNGCRSVRSWSKSKSKSKSKSESNPALVGTSPSWTAQTSLPSCVSTATIRLRTRLLMFESHHACFRYRYRYR
jgi:hypothetical protein